LSSAHEESGKRRNGVVRSVARQFAAAALVAELLIGAPGTLASAADAATPTAAELMDALMWNHGPIGAPFDLIDQHGRRRTDAQFRGKLLILYFGYTNCPDVCPTDLTAISSAVDSLGLAGNNVQPIFITVDPQRDTVEHLRRYVSSFHPRLVALTGSEHDIHTLALAYKVYYEKIAAEHGEPYAIYHTGFIYLVDIDGKYLGFFPPGTRPDRMVEIIRQHLPQ
jgi:cytochrome oxidase Cu insertion factor (SCO1/SenC/PrrC family)